MTETPANTPEELSDQFDAGMELIGKGKTILGLLEEHMRRRVTRSGFTHGEQELWNCIDTINNDFGRWAERFIGKQQGRQR